MLFSPGIAASARRQGTKELAGRALPGERFTQVSEVIELLTESTSPAAQPGARVLLRQMALAPWKLIRGAHRSPADATLHVTIEVGKKRYHLRLDARSCLFDITHVVGDRTERPAGRQPWVPPGA